MKLYGTPRSPYARKVRIVLAEKNIPYELIVTRGSTPDSPVPALNPLGKVPTLQRDDGRALYDSPVIVEYLDGLGSGPKLIPEDFESRIEVKRWEALGDGITEATVNINHEYREPADKQRSAAWFEKQRQKIDRGLARMEQDLGSGEFCFGKRFTLADIAAGYALGYLDFALAEVEWRKAHPALARLAERLAARPSFSSTLQAPRA
ncbi:MAG: glutathione S-transferase N-terminal domain-containing protein [Burkholderiales bacterium]|nr:glutathione S-transferase N-terminal domain-containing protein [Burkholderiales bacterium]MDP2399511.1 glutathione S-transferase N-terminal domain-containing protein [Burkholderiales bacterium]